MKFFKIFLILSTLTIGTFAQSASIFSNTQYGLGLSNHFLSTSAMGMGNAGLANSDSLNLNMYNYSQWSKNKHTFFSLNITGEYNNFETASIKDTKSTGSIGALMLSLPLISGKLSSYITMLPGYAMEHKNYMKLHEGDEYENDFYLSHAGHVSQFNFGMAYNVNPYLQVAGNFIYYSGKYTDEYVVSFSDSQFETQTFTDIYKVKGYGAAFSSTLNLNKKIALGLYFERVFNCNFKIEPAEYGFGSGENKTKETSLPYNLGVGLALHPNKRWNIALDYIYKNWETGVPTFIEDQTYFEDIHQYYGGFEYRPETKWNASIFKQIVKRFGVFGGNEGYKFNNNSVKFTGVSAGLGIPANPYGAVLDVAVSVGIRGNLDDNNAKEDFIKFSVSLKAVEKWFVRKRK